jgi:hypothetical protein
MISLLRIIESYGAEGQFYDIGRDFSSFRRMIDGADQQIKQQYEKSISDKLVGKRIRARASRGYKQYVKDYEFDVTKITLDDYYDNFVIVAYDSTTPKPKEYFLKTGFKLQILGPATGKPSPQKGGDPRFEKQQQPGPTTIQPTQNPQVAQSQPMALAPIGQTPQEIPMKEGQNDGLYDAYGVDEIAEDLKSWLPEILSKPNTALREFVKGIGWRKDIDDNTKVSMYDLRIPSNMVKPNVNEDTLRKMLEKASETPVIGEERGKFKTRYDLVKLDPDKKKSEWNVRIKKVTTKV